MSVPALGVELAELELKLLAWLREKMPDAESLAISDLEPATAGFSNLSLVFTLTWREGDRPRSTPMFFRGASTATPVYPDPKLERQYRVMERLHGAGVAVPEVYWMEEDPGILGWPFYVMSRVEGAVPSEIPTYHSFGLCYDATPEQRARMWWSTVAAMAKVHTLDWRELGLEFLGVPPSGTGPLDRELEYWSAYLDWARDEPQPILEATLEWLRANRYAPERVSLCWGDARLPNAMFGPDGELVALLDWDMAILGDPEWDLAFMLTFDWLLTEGSGVARLEGFPGREETIARYEELTGRRVEHYAFSEVFAAFRTGAVILRVQKNLVELGITPPDAANFHDNFCTRRLAGLLGLPQPGSSESDVPVSRSAQRQSG
jgi:aminoglycoside phosphotransferase (APT) family kinase protein